VNEGVHAGFGAALVRARLERYVQSRAARGLLRVAESGNFRVIDAAPGMKAAAHYGAIANQHRTDGRIRACTAFSLARQFQRFQHVI
jgi:hypothetical protein